MASYIGSDENCRHAAVAAALIGTVGDPDGTRTVTSIIVLLVALGLALIMIAFWMWRTTRPDPEVLAPLEVMGQRTWRRADPVWQRRRLDEVRPEGAEPLVPSAAPPEIDEAFEAGPTASGFDDLDGEIVPPERVTDPIADESDDPPHRPPRTGSWTPPKLERPPLGAVPGDSDDESRVTRVPDDGAERGTVSPDD